MPKRFRIQSSCHLAIVKSPVAVHPKRGNDKLGVRARWYGLYFTCEPLSEQNNPANAELFWCGKYGKPGFNQVGVLSIRAETAWSDSNSLKITSRCYTYRWV